MALSNLPIVLLTAIEDDLKLYQYGGFEPSAATALIALRQLLF